MSHLVGVRVYQHYAWQYDGLEHIAIHGHQFDGFQVNNLRFSRLGTSLYLQLQKLDFKSKPIARLIDRLNTRWLRMSSKVAAGALHYARQHHADRIFCGHTHQAVQVEENGIHYYNAGGWVDSRLTYLTVDEQGVRIHEFNEPAHQERADNRDSSQERGEADSSFADVADESGLREDVEYQGVGR
jgi:UDP-2,3-diacylglucosamine pyrophosphatase LpxH